METILKLDRVSLRRSGTVILDELSWEIRPGEHWAFVGPNGSGKTMTLKVVTGQLWPSDGTASLLGHEFGSYDLRELRKAIGLVSFDLQHTFMNRTDSALEVVLSGHYSSIGLFDAKPEPELVKKARSMLFLLGCDHAIDRSFRAMSHGEQKRVLIARALINDPKLLVLDEPCTGLDLAVREQFLSLVQDMITAEGGPLATVFVTHHSEEILPYISHCHLLKQGQTLAQGPRCEVLTQENYSKLYELDVTLTEREDRLWTQIA